MQNYVLGFLFSEDRKQVALIKKIKPIEQAGLLNGIGGKIEKDESILSAMEREFKEETGVEIKGWKCFATMNNYAIGDILNNLWRVYCFVNFSDKIFDVKTIEAEEVFIIPVINIHNYEALSNISWLIPMALDNHNFGESEIKYY